MNLLYDFPTELSQELFSTVFASPNVRIERIVSHGHASPPGFWYDQDEAEWVMVLSGAARLQIEGAESAIELRPGDHVNIPAHQRHRVEWTTPGEPTVWLVVFHGASVAPEDSPSTPDVT